MLETRLLKTITTETLLSELYRRARRASERTTGPTFDKISGWLKVNCDFDQTFEVKFSVLYDALDFDISRHKFSQHLNSTYGITLRNGTANVKYIRGLKLKEKE